MIHADTLKAARRLLFVIAAVYIVFLLLNLVYLPVAWLDEICYLDPAVNFVKKGHYASRLWGYKGTQEVFLTHLPMLQWVHIASLTLFPRDIFFIRLPFAVFFIVSLWYYRKWLQLRGHHAVAILLIILFFIFDKGVYELIRSMRMESVELLLMVLSLYLLSRNKYPWLNALFISCLALTHPAVWAMALVLFIYLLKQTKDLQKQVLLVGLACLPLIAYLSIGHFNMQLYYEQLVKHGRDHTSDTVPGNLLWKHFIGRFMHYTPATQQFRMYYTTQPYVMLVNVIALWQSLRVVVKKKPFAVAEWLLLATNVYWLFVTGPFYRYNVVLLALAYPLCAEWLKDLVLSRFSFSLKPFALSLVAVLLCAVIGFEFFARNIVAVLQRESRSPYAFYEWLDKSLPVKKGEKVLLIEPCSAYYYSLRHPNTSFAIKEYLQNFNFSDYDKVYYISTDTVSLKKPALAVYKPASNSLLKSLPLPQSGVTLDNLHLYEVSDTAQFNSLVEEEGWR